MSNTFKTTTWMAKEALRHLENNLTLTKFVDKSYAKDYTNPNVQTGTTISIPKPARAIATSGGTASFPDHTEENMSVTVSQYNASFAPTSVELGTSIARQQWSERYIRPYAIALANKIDSDGFTAAMTGVYNATGTAGTTPSTVATYLTGGAILAEFAMPMDGEVAAIVNPAAQASILDATKGLFQSATEVGEQYKTGKMGLAFGYKWSMDQNVGRHTTGQQGGTPLVNAASQTGASLITDGWTAAAANRLKAGDSFTLAGVYAVNPVSKVSTNRLQTFVATADAASDGSGNCTISIAPSIVTSGTLQTVSGSPADNAALTIQGASTVQSENLILHKQALTLVSLPLPTYGGTDKCAIEHDPDTGVTVRVTQGMDITNDKLLVRLDVLYGWGVCRPEWAVKVLG